MKPNIMSFLVGEEIKAKRMVKLVDGLAFDCSSDISKIKRAIEIPVVIITDDRLLESGKEENHG